jgi:hypothetical protein
VLVLLGNVSPQEAPGGELVSLPGPALTTFGISDAQNEDGSYVVGYISGTDTLDVLREFATHRGGVMHFGGNELIHSTLQDWDLHSSQPPAFVCVVPEDRDPDNAEDFERFLSEYWGCARGLPGDLEETYYTQVDKTIFPPGESPEE